MLTSGPPLRVPPKPPPSLRGSQPFTVLARSTSTNTLRPSIFLPSACLYAAKRYQSKITIRQWIHAPKWLVYEVYVPSGRAISEKPNNGMIPGAADPGIGRYIKILNCLAIRIGRYWIRESFTRKQKNSTILATSPSHWSSNPPGLWVYISRLRISKRQLLEFLWSWTIQWSNNFRIYGTSKKVERPTKIGLDTDS